MDILGGGALHPSEQRLLGVALKLDHFSLHGRTSCFGALHRGVACRQGLEGWKVAGQLLNLVKETMKVKEKLRAMSFFNSDNRGHIPKNSNGGPLYLEIEDDGPYQPEDDGRASVCDVRRVNVHQFDLKQKPGVTYSLLERIARSIHC